MLDGSVWSAMTFDWSTYTGNVDWLPRRTLFMTRHGSHAYGTSTPTSDVDLRGICVAPRAYQLGFLHSVRIVEQKVPDLAVFELREFFRQAVDGAAPVIEMLFTDPSDHLVRTPLMDRLFAARHRFLSTKLRHTFRGFAFANLKRMQSAHERGEVGGYGKRACHVVRLMRMCREILTRGEVIVRRPDAEELLAIRGGAWTYEEVCAWAEREDAALAELPTSLPREVDRGALDALCVDMIAASLEPGA